MAKAPAQKSGTPLLSIRHIRTCSSQQQKEHLNLPGCIIRCAKRHQTHAKDCGACALRKNLNTSMDSHFAF